MVIYPRFSKSVTDPCLLIIKKGDGDLSIPKKCDGLLCMSESVMDPIYLSRSLKALSRRVGTSSVGAAAWAMLKFGFDPILFCVTSPILFSFSVTRPT